VVHPRSRLRAEHLEGRLTANFRRVRGEAALGNQGGFFHFRRSLHATRTLSTLPNTTTAGPEALMAKHSALTRASGVRCPAGPLDPLLGDRSTAGRQALTLLIEVRLLVPEFPSLAFPDNRIVNDARGRAPPWPRRCPRSLSGEGAWLKPRRCWFDSRRGHFVARVVAGFDSRPRAFW
jgi:hypothetical protein